MRSVTLSAAQLGRATRVLPRTNPAVTSPVNNLWLKLMAILLQVKMNGTLQMSKRASFDALEKLKCRSFSENVAQDKSAVCVMLALQYFKICIHMSITLSRWQSSQNLSLFFLTVLLYPFCLYSLFLGKPRTVLLAIGITSLKSAQNFFN